MEQYKIYNEICISSHGVVECTKYIWQNDLFWHNHSCNAGKHFNI